MKRWGRELVLVDIVEKLLVPVHEVGGVVVGLDGARFENIVFRALQPLDGSLVRQRLLLCNAPLFAFIKRRLLQRAQERLWWERQARWAAQRSDLACVQRVAQGEARINWVLPREAALHLPFVRETVMFSSSRTRNPARRYTGMVVAFTELARGAGAEGGVTTTRRVWQRRAWVLRTTDHTYPRSSCPVEGVLVSSIQPGEPSVPAWPQLQRLHLEAKGGGT